MALINGGGTPVCPPGFHYDKTFNQCMPGVKCSPGSLEALLGLCDPEQEQVQNVRIGIRLPFVAPVPTGIFGLWQPIFQQHGWLLLRADVASDGKTVEAEAESKGASSVASKINGVTAAVIAAIRLLGIGIGVGVGTWAITDPQNFGSFTAGKVKSAIVGIGSGVIGNGDDKPKPVTEDLKNLLYFGVGLGLILLIVKR